LSDPVIGKFKSIEHLAKDTELSEIERWINAFDYISDKDIAKKYWLHWFYGTMRNLMTEYYYEYILILIGKQNAGKSYAIQHGLTSPFKGYCTDNFHWGKTTDDKLQLSQNFIIYDDEYTARARPR